MHFLGYPHRFRHQETQSSRLQTLDLYWVSRDANKLDWFKALFSMEKTVELFKTGLIRIHVYFTSSERSQHRSTRIFRPVPATRRSRESIHSLHSIRTDAFASGQYSEDDEENDEGEELLSPRETLASSSLISLSSNEPRTQEDRRSTRPSARAKALDQPGGDEDIIGLDNIHFGRPDFAAVFDDMKEALAQQSRGNGPVKVGVFYCGSLGLGKSLAQECRRTTTSSIQFTFMSE